MRNLVVVQDAVEALSTQNPVGERLAIDSIVSMACNQAVGKLYLLTLNGKVICFDNNEGLHWKYSTTLCFDGVQEHWFQVDYVAVTNTVVCISQEGSIVCIEEDVVDGTPKEPDQIGMIEGGIASAKWHPDYSCLLMLTNNHTLICMSNTWDVLNEADIPPRNLAIPGTLSWKGDGELIALVTTDAEDNVAKVRILNPQLEVVAVSRNVGEGPAATMKGIGAIVSFATNGSYVATHQAKPGGGHQVALVEKNGLRHGDFDIRTPAVAESHAAWEVVNLEWDLTSTLVAVGLRSMNNGGKAFTGCVQIYYRENYHWYLKQQWIDQDLKFLGFDAEVANKLYLTQTMLDVVSREYCAALRVVDVYWAMSRSESRDSSVCVTDGAKLLYTPLGYNTVPPPMSMFQESFESWDASLKSASAKQSVFWTTSSSAAGNHRWGNAILLNDQGDVLFTFGDDRGKITRSIYTTFKQLARQILVGQEQAIAEFSMIKFRNILVTQDEDKVVVYFLGSKAKLHDIVVDQAPGSFSFSDGVGHGDDAEDVLVSIAASSEVFFAASKDQQPAVFTSMRLLDGFAGRVYHMSAIVNTAHDIAVGLSNNLSNDYEILRLSAADWQWGSGEAAMWLHHDGDGHSQDQIIATIPEVSPLFTVICNQQSIDEDEKARAENPALPGEDDDIKAFTVIALSSRNRLYCGDIMLVAGASSYAFNNSFHLLMFITLGTKPHLHFASLPTLQRLHALQQSSEDQVIFECAEPRPVERGAKLVTSVANDSKVVIQLPRGNLEVFEPRPMILLKAQRLLVSHQLLDCLVLLRRQRVDLNYLVDFDPNIFMGQVQSFVQQVVTSNADLLSLFITSLETADVTIQKYYFFDRSMIPYRIQRREYITQYQFEGEKKVNQVCEVLRKALLAQVVENSDMIARIMNPMLCSFAKQRPPLLVDALQMMKTLCQQSKATSNVVTMPAAIKYLAFLVEGSQLFDAALSVCDFEMARTVARQCQMDPKVYLPLLESFENIAKGSAVGSAAYYLMHYQVSVHLKKYAVSSEHFVKLLQAMFQEPQPDSEAFSKLLSTVYDLLEKEVDYIKQDSLFLTILPKIVSFEQSLRSILLQASAPSAVVSSSCVDCIRTYITAVRKAYAAKALSDMNYAAAINAYLSTYPPSATEAVDAALAQGNWQAALSIAGRFHHVVLDNKGQKLSALDPTRIAQEIVSTFRQNQEFVSYVGSVAAEEGDQLGSSSSGQGGGSTDEEEDKALLAARFSIDYCQDAESAVSILTTAHQWTRAVEVACQQNRIDLLDEIFGAGRLAAKELNKFVEDCIQKLPALVTELSELWKNPTERMDNIASTEADLQAELQEKDEDANKEDVNDNSSEFSAATKYSTSSLLSSTSSIRSGTSTVSILSDISDKTAASSQSTASTAFSIEGLEHGLLSRGSANSYSGENRNANGKVYKRDRTPRRQKRIERSKTKGYSKDVWGLRRENELCLDMFKYAQLKTYSKAVNELCELLVAANTAEDHFLATTLTSNMQKLVKLVQNNTAPIAPAYPKEWLTKRAMTIVTFYQDPKQRLESKLNRRFGSMAMTGARDIALTEAEVEELVQSKTWWQIAKEGIEFWFNSKMLNLLLPQADEE